MKYKFQIYFYFAFAYMIGLHNNTKKQKRMCVDTQNDPKIPILEV